MRSFLATILVILLAGWVSVPAARAVDVRIDHVDCGFDSSYDVTVLPEGIRFQREDGSPRQVFMHDGTLRVDGRMIAVSSADADNLRRFESELRTVLPQMARIAREGVDIGYDAVTTVAATLAADPDQQQSLVDRLNASHAEALRRIDDTLGRGQWHHDALRTLIEGSVRDTVPTLVGTVTSEALKAALSGDRAQLAALQARADSLDKSIDKQVDARADRLQHQAEAMCPRLQDLDQLQQQWHFRLADGSALHLISADHHGDH